MKRVLIFLAVFSCLAAGCGKQTKVDGSIPLCRVVTHITVESPQAPQRLYSSPDKMRRILNYLRLLEPFPPEQPSGDMPQQELYRITLYQSDGSSQTYLQMGDRFIQQESQPWQAIDPDQGGKLPSLLHAIPGDKQR